MYSDYHVLALSAVLLFSDVTFLQRTSSDPCNPYFQVGAGLPVIASVTRVIASGDPISRIVGSLSGT